MKDRGAGRELEQEAKRLARGLVAPGQKPRLGVKISIPNDHPLAKELLELATLLANRQKLASGIEVLRPGVPNADAQLLALLERMGVPTAQILKDVGAKVGRKDALLDFGLRLVTAVSGISGSKVDLDAVTRELTRDPDQKS